MKAIGIANDHAGTELKNEIMKRLSGHFVFENYGTDDNSSVDYPDFVHPLAKAVSNGEHAYGILICGSGNGVCMTANKYQNIRAALCWNNELSQLAREHNNANILCIPARFIDTDTAMAMVQTFLSTNFEGGRHQKRVEKIAP